MCATMPHPNVFIFVSYASDLYIYQYLRNMVFLQKINRVA